MESAVFISRSTIILSKTLRALLVAVLLGVGTGSNYGQTNESVQQDITSLVKGTVYDEMNLPMPGADVVLKNSDQGVITDYNGKFVFPKPLAENDILVFSYMGYQSKEYLIPENAPEILEITIQFEEPNIILVGEVDVDRLYTGKNKKKSH